MISKRYCSPNCRLYLKIIQVITSAEEQQKVLKELLIGLSRIVDGKELNVEEKKNSSNGEVNNEKVRKEYSMNYLYVMETRNHL